MSTEVKERQNYIDTIKGIGILFVILAHIDNSPDMLVKFIHGFAMPLFFFLTGYLYNELKWNNESFLYFIKTRVTAYLKPFFGFLLFNIFIYNPFREYSKSHDLSLIPDSILVNIKAVIPFTNDYTNFGPAVIPLWYFLCAFFSCIIFRVIFYAKKDIVRIIACIILIAVYGIMLYDGSYALNPYLPWHIETSFIGTALMIAGFYFRKLSSLEYKNKALVNNILMLLFPIGVCFIEINKRVDMFCYIYGRNVIEFYLAALFVIIGLFAIFAGHNISISLLSKYGRDTVLIIGLNIILISFSNQIWYHLPFFKNHNFHYLICFLAVSFILWIIIELKNRLFFRVK